MAIRVLFFGTSSFAVPILERLTRYDRFDIVAVVTQPDRPVGRHAEVSKSPVKEKAEALGLPIKQFETLKNDEVFNELKTIHSDVGVVASYGQIIPQRVLDVPTHGMVNVHGSLLPNYRGASPIQAAIKNGDKETGVTIMKMDALMDHGPIFQTAVEPIRSDDTGGTLHDRLAQLGATTLPDVLAKYVEGNIQPQEQNHAASTTVKLLTREDGLIDWTKSAEEIERTIRAYDPWPGTYMLLDEKRLKILRAAVGDTTSKTGRLIDDGYPSVVCGDGKILRLVCVQPEGKSPMDGKDFLRGYKNWA